MRDRLDGAWETVSNGVWEKVLFIHERLYISIARALLSMRDSIYDLNERGLLRALLSMQDSIYDLNFTIREIKSDARWYHRWIFGYVLVVSSYSSPYTPIYVIYVCNICKNCLHMFFRLTKHISQMHISQISTKFLKLIWLMYFKDKKV